MDTLNNLIIDENLTIGYNFENDNEVFSFIDTDENLTIGYNFENDNEVFSFIDTELNFTSKNIKLLISKMLNMI